MFIKIVLLHLEFDKPFQTDLFYLNCFDENMFSFRVTMYSNIRENKDYAATVEILNQEIPLDQLKERVISELREMKLISPLTQCLNSSLILKNGFPVPLKSSNITAQSLKTRKNNVSICGRATGGSFYLNQVLDTYDICENLT